MLKLPRHPALRVMFFAAALAPLICALAFLAGAAFGLPAGATLRTTRGALLAYAGLAALAALPVAALALLALRARPTGQARFELLAAGLEPGDYELIGRLFPASDEVRLSPIEGGYSGAAVLRAQSWGPGGALQRPSVVKVGRAAKLLPEVEGYGRYVREYVGNTAVLLGSERRGDRAALRWSYAAFAGDDVRTFADYVAAGGALAPVVEALFAPGSTLGLLLGAPRRDPERLLYREYAWPPGDWERIAGAAALLGAGTGAAALPFEPGTPDPLPIVAAWMGLGGAPAERAARSFDAPAAVVHGDLNSRNVLVDSRGAVFLIDFAHSGPGHLLRDFARLEAELLLAMDPPADAAEAAARVALAERLLGGADSSGLRQLLQADPGDGPRAAGVAALRRKAHDFCGPWLSGPAEPYLLALLHTTLDTLRYAQCGPDARRAALAIAGRLCRALA